MKVDIDIKMVKQINFELSDVELKKYLVAKGDKSHREAILKALGISTERRVSGPKRQQIGLQRIQKMYDEVINELEEVAYPEIEDLAVKLRTAGKLEESSAVLNGHHEIFKTMRDGVKTLTLKAVDDITKQAARTLLTPPEIPSFSKILEGKQAGRDPLGDYKRKLSKWKVDMLLMKKKPEAPVKKEIDVGLMHKAEIMASRSSLSYEQALKKLRDEKRAAEK